MGYINDDEETAVIADDRYLLLWKTSPYNNLLLHSLFQHLRMKGREVYFSNGYHW